MSRAALLTLLAAAVAVAQPKPPDYTPEEKAARDLMTTPAGLDRYVVAADTSPKPAGTKYPADAAACDRTGKPALTLAAPGPYFVRLTLAPEGRAPLVRFATAYRVKQTPAPTWTFDPTKPEELAAVAGVDVKAVTRQTKLVADVCGKKTFEQLAADPRFARLLAGLALTPPTEAVLPATRLDDAFAYERQGWVVVRRKLTGLDQEFPKPFDAPTPIAAEPAAVVREGTEREAGVKPGTAARLDAVLKAWADDDDQAFAVCVVRDGVIVLHQAYGTRDGRPMTVTTPSWMASVTKPMSAFLVLMLADRGLLALDDPVSRFVPALREVRVAKPLLIRHLHTHTNGLDRFPSGDDTLNDLEYRVADAYPALRVGAAWAYNGGGYALGGKVIENVTGEAVPLAYKRHLLDPLGCTGTEVSGTHADAYSVPLDMARFGQMLLNRGAYGRSRFVSPETFDLMLPRRLTAELGPDAQKVFGFGLDGQPRKFGHGAASAATFHVDVDRRLVVVMTRNKMGKNQDRYNGKFWDAINAGIEPAR